MASILVLDQCGEGIPIALRLAQEGNIVKRHSSEAKNLLDGRPNLNEIGQPLKLLEQFDLILGYPGAGEYCDEARKTSRLTLGGGGFSDKLLEEEYHKKVLSLILGRQEFPKFIPKESITVRVEGWFIRESFLPLYTISLPYLRFLEGDRGQLTDGMGSYIVNLNPCQLTERFLLPFTPLIAKVGYQGPFSLLCMIQEDNVFVETLTAGFQEDTFSALTELSKVGVFSFFWALSQAEGVNLAKEIALSIKLSLPPYPFNFKLLPTPQDKISLTFPPQALRHIWLRSDRDGSNVLGWVTARGDDLHEAKRRVYRTIGNVVQNEEIQYRRDIGQGVDEKMGKLRTWGWI
jgi:hypothetical protein